MRPVDNGERSEHQKAGRAHDNQRQPPPASPADSGKHNGNLAILRAQASALPEQRMNLARRLVSWLVAGQHQTSGMFEFPDGRFHHGSMILGAVLCCRRRQRVQVRTWSWGRSGSSTSQPDQ